MRRKYEKLDNDLRKEFVGPTVRPKSFNISLTRKCTSNCEFCNLPKDEKPSATLLPLVCGSVLDQDIKTILSDFYENNHFLRKVKNKTVFGIGFEFGLNYLSSDACSICYKLRKMKKMRKKFNIRDDYSVTKSLPDNLLKKVIDDLSEIGVKELSFADEGEPTLEFEKLCKLAETSKGKFKTISLYTNCSFASTKDKTLLMLRKLKQSGINKINISWDESEKYKFHQHFVPVEKVVAVFQLCKKIGMDIRISSTYSADQDMKAKKKRARELFGDIRISIFSENPVKRLFFRKSDLTLSPIRMNSKVEERIDGRDVPSFDLPFVKHLGRLFLIVPIFKHLLSRNCFSYMTLNSNGLVCNCNYNTS